MKKIRIVFISFFILYAYNIWALFVSPSLSLEYGYGSAGFPVYYNNSNRYIVFFSSLTNWNGYDEDMLVEIKPFGNNYTKLFIYSFLSSEIDMRDDNGVLIGTYRCGNNQIGYETGDRIGNFYGMINIGLKDEYINFYHYYSVYGKISVSFILNDVKLGIVSGIATDNLRNYDLSFYISKSVSIYTIMNVLVYTGGNWQDIVSLYRDASIFSYGMDLGILEEIIYVNGYLRYKFNNYNFIFSTKVNKYPYNVFSLESNIGLIVNF